MACEVRASRVPVEAPISRDPRGALRFGAMSSSHSIMGDKLVKSANGGFRPDAALLPLLPPEFHPAHCDCDACARRRPSQSHS